MLANSFWMPMMTAKTRASLPTTSALNANRARAPMASGTRAMAFIFNNINKGMSIFWCFFFLPRAEKKQINKMKTTKTPDGVQSIIVIWERAA